MKHTSATSFTLARVRWSVSNWRQINGFSVSSGPMSPLGLDSSPLKFKQLIADE
jgi:hypothetical protein